MKTDRQVECCENFENSKNEPTEELSNNDWYHGRITRIEAESRVLYNGEFLVRDCISKPGHYVLTCNWDGRPAHFVINRIDPAIIDVNMTSACIADQSTIDESTGNNSNNDSNKNDVTKSAKGQQDAHDTDVNNNSLKTAEVDRTCFQIEDKVYPCVRSLIEAYVSLRKPVTQNSMCIISKAVKCPHPKRLARLEPFYLPQERSLPIDQPDSFVMHTIVGTNDALKVETAALKTSAARLNAIGNHYINNTNTSCIPSSLLTTAINTNDVIKAKNEANFSARHSANFLLEKSKKPAPIKQWLQCDHFNGKADILGAYGRADPASEQLQTLLLADWVRPSLLDQRNYYMPCGKIEKYDLEADDMKKCSRNPDTIVDSNLSMQSRPLPPVPTKLSKGDRDSGIGNPPIKPQVCGLYGSGQRTDGGSFFKNFAKDVASVSGNRLRMDDEEDDDYHEYCDIDYDEPGNGRVRSMTEDVVFRTSSASKSRANSNDNRRNDGVQMARCRMGLSKLSASSFNAAPPLPPRATGSLAARDSACVPDIGIYDKVNSENHLRFQRLISQPLESRINLGHFILPKAIPYNEPIKPLDIRLWPDLLDSILFLSSLRLTHLICEADLNFLDIRRNGNVRGKCQNFRDKSTNNFFFYLFLIPAGRQFRLDILERHNCWRRFVQVSLLNVEDAQRRTTLLAKWIDVAEQLYSTYLNLFAFGYIMAALGSEQVCSLNKTWQKLRVDFTELALIYETQLKPSFTALQRNPCEKIAARDALVSEYGHLYSVPDLEPMAKLLEADSSCCTWLFDWEESDEDFGIFIENVLYL